MLIAGCGGGDATGSDAVRGVKAHDLADSPRPRSELPFSGSHPVTLRRLTVGRDGVYGVLAMPTDLRRRTPAVVTFGGSDGGNGTVPLARAFASEGFPALAIAYFKAPGLPRQLDRIPLEYFARAVRTLARRPDVDPARVALAGASRGGEAALLVASTYPKLVHGAIALVPDYQTNSGWTLHGRPVPYDRVIPVERIRGPVLTASGGRDQVWSSSVYTDQIELRLRDSDFRYAHTRLNFPNAGHRLLGTAPTLFPHMLAFMRALLRRA